MELVRRLLGFPPKEPKPWWVKRELDRKGMFELIQNPSEQTLRAMLEVVMWDAEQNLRKK